MKIRFLFFMLIALVAISCSTGTANLRIQKAAEVNYKKLGKIAFVVNDPTGEETFSRLKECIPEPVEETLAEGNATNESGTASAGFSLTMSSNKPKVTVTPISQQELSEIKQIVNASLQSIAQKAQGMQIAPADQADTVINVSTSLSKEKEWNTRKTTNPELLPFGACYSNDGQPITRMAIKISMDIKKNGESIQQVERSADDYSGMGYNEDCYFSLEPGQTREPDIIPVCQTRLKSGQKDGQDIYAKVYIDFDKRFMNLKNSIYNKVVASLPSAFLILEENVPVTFFKIKKPEGVKEAHSYMKENQWSSAKNVYEKLLPSLDSTPDMEPEEKANFYHNYALTLMAEGSFDKALEMVEKAKGIFNNEDYNRTTNTLQYLIENEKKLNEQK